jgi:hypothetical protein
VQGPAPIPQVAPLVVRLAHVVQSESDDPLRIADVGHEPEGLVLADGADQPIAVRGQPIDRRLEVIDVEGDVAQSQPVGHCGGRSGLMVGPDEARELQAGTSIGWAQHNDLGAGVGDADHGSWPGRDGGTGQPSGPRARLQGQSPLRLRRRCSRRRSSALSPS